MGCPLESASERLRCEEDKDDSKAVIGLRSMTVGTGGGGGGDGEEHTCAAGSISTESFQSSNELQFSYLFSMWIKYSTMYYLNFTNEETEANKCFSWDPSPDLCSSRLLSKTGDCGQNVH